MPYANKSSETNLEETIKQIDIFEILQFNHRNQSSLG